MLCNNCNGSGKWPSGATRVDYVPQPMGGGWKTMPVVRELDTYVQCGRCRGTGQMKVTYVQDTCPRCNGFRVAWVEAPGTYPSGMPKQARGPCPVCSGNGYVQGERYEPDYS